MNIRPGGNFSFAAFTETAAQVPTNADSLPASFLFRNGQIDTNVVVTVAPVSGKTGMYALTGTVPATYQTGDVVQVIIEALVSGITSYAVAGEFVVRSILGRFSYVPGSTTLQYQEDDGATPLAGTGPLVLQITAGDITKR